MTSRRIGFVAIVLGLAVVAWSWIGLWPWGGPAISSGSDFAAINGVALGVTILGCLAALIGVFLLFAGRGGPEDWSRR